MVTIDLVHTYMVNCERRGLSQATIRWYSFFLKNFARLFPELPLSPEPIEEWIYAHKTGDERRYGAFRCLRAFYNFVESRIFIEQKLDLANPFHQIIPPRRSQKEKWALNLEELRRLLEYPEHDPIIRTLLHLLADTGIRIGEAVSVASEDIGADSVRVTGKTGQRIVPISAKVRQMLLQLGPGKLFPHRVHWWGSEVSRAFREVGLPGTAHTLRHTFCTLFDGNDRGLMTITGHKSFQMIQNYSHRKLESAKEQHKEHGPLAKLYGNESTTAAPESAITPEPGTSQMLQAVITLAKELGAAQLQKTEAPAVSDTQLEPSQESAIIYQAKETKPIEMSAQGYDGSSELNEARFLFHSAMHRLCFLGREELELGGTNDAVKFLVSRGYLRGRNGKGSRSELKKYINEKAEVILGMLRTRLYTAALQHYSMAKHYGEQCVVKAQPGAFSLIE